MADLLQPGSILSDGVNVRGHVIFQLALENQVMPAREPLGVKVIGLGVGQPTEVLVFEIVNK